MNDHADLLDDFKSYRTKYSNTKKSLLCMLMAVGVYVLNWVFYMFLSGLFPSNSFIIFSYFLDLTVFFISCFGLLYFIRTFFKFKEKSISKFLIGFLNLIIFGMFGLIFYTRILDWWYGRL